MDKCVKLIFYTCKYDISYFWREGKKDCAKFQLCLLCGGCNLKVFKIEVSPRQSLADDDNVKRLEQAQLE